MSLNIRQHIATKTVKLWILRFGMPTELLSPFTGNWITTTADDGILLQSEVLYDTEKIDPETGDLIVVGKTQVSFARIELDRIPAAGEKWSIRIPLNPAFPTVLSTFMIDAGRAPEDGQTIGYVKYYLKKLEDP